jgi:hypothetical protein
LLTPARRDAVLSRRDIARMARCRSARYVSTSAPPNALSQWTRSEGDSRPSPDYRLARRAETMKREPELLRLVQRRARPDDRDRHALLEALRDSAAEIAAEVRRRLRA